MPVSWARESCTGGGPWLAISGDAMSGFGIYHYDGSAEFPPTDSEAAAECAGYDTALERIQCRTEVRV